MFTFRLTLSFMVTMIISFAHANFDPYNPATIINSGLVGVASPSTKSVSGEWKKILDKLEAYSPGITSKKIYFDIEEIDSNSLGLKKYLDKSITVESRNLMLETFICTKKSFESWNRIKRNSCNPHAQYIKLSPLKSVIVIPIENIAYTLAQETPDSVIFEANLEYLGGWKRTLGSNRFSFSQLLKNPLQVPLNHDSSVILHVEIR